MGKFRKIFTPDWSAIFQNLYANLIWMVVSPIVVLIWILVLRFDPLGLKLKASTYGAILLYLLMAYGLWNLFFVVVKLIHKKWPPQQDKVIRKFRKSLDGEIKKMDNISGLGLAFLKNVKTAPPFLGQPFSFIDTQLEQEITEYFVARDFMKLNAGNVRGSFSYTMRGDDTHKKIAKRVYGDAKYEDVVKNARVQITPGTYIKLPFIDTSNTLNLTSEELEIKFIHSSPTWIKPILENFKYRYNLVEGEVLPLLEKIYESAKKARMH